MRMKQLLTVFLLLVLGACTHSVHVVYAGSDSLTKTVDSKKLIKAEAEQFSVLGFVGNTEYVDDAAVKLAKQCPDKEIHGVVTEYWTSHGFFSWTNKVRMQAYCN